MRALTPYAKFVTAILFRMLQRFEYEVRRLSETQDIEALHQTRVYIRRLRMAFSLFKSTLMLENTDWYDDIVEFSQTLRHARDLDVQIEALQKFMDQTSTLYDRAGISELIVLLSVLRKKEERKIKKARRLFLAKKPFSQARKSMLRLLKKPKSSQQEHAMTDQIKKRLARVIERKDHILEMPVEELHDLRKGIRYLRYELDIFYAYLPDKKTEDTISVVKQFQEYLGNIHDADIWLEYLPEYARIASVENRLSICYIEDAIEWLRELWQNRREKEFEQFVFVWEKKSQKGYWESLRGQLSAFSVKD